MPDLVPIPKQTHADPDRNRFESHICTSYPHAHRTAVRLDGIVRLLVLRRWFFDHGLRPDVHAAEAPVRLGRQEGRSSSSRLLASTSPHLCLADISPSARLLTRVPCFSALPNS